MDFYINSTDAGKTIKTILKENKISTKFLRHLKYTEEGITVNGEHKTVRYVLQVGDLLTLSDSEEDSGILPVDLPLSILYEDEYLVVPSKPANMPTHPSHDHHEDTVANALAYRYGTPYTFHPVNRLDRNTSGLLLIARNRYVADLLVKQMQKGDIKKTYVAVLDGELEQDEGTIDRPLHRTAESIIVREICSPDTPDAQSAKTEYRVLERKNGHTLVEASPVTGRTHQLRVHFASIGHPITGDDLYGTESPYIHRHALHARTLSFTHPLTKERMNLKAPLPDDFKELLRFYSFQEEL